MTAKRVFAIRLDDDVRSRLDAIAAETRLTRGHLIRESLRWYLDPGPPLAKALAVNADAPWLNPNGYTAPPEAEHG
jgi:predicted DNA-binding protein